MSSNDQMTESDLHNRVIGLIDGSIDAATQGPRQRACERRDYKDNEQWTSAEKKILHGRKESCITDNLIKDKVDTYIGIEQKLRTDPKAYPRNPDDEEAATAATKALRYVADKNQLNEEFTLSFESMLVEGTQAIEVTVSGGSEGKNGEIDCMVVPWDRLILDQHSRRLDYSDARFVGQMIWMDIEEAKERFKSAAEEISEMQSEDWQGEYEDEPERWYQPQRRRVLIFELYFKRNKEVLFCRGWRGGFIDEPKPSPYEDEYGATLWPYVIQSSWVNRHGERIGVVERFMDPQRNVNKRLSKLLHYLNKNQAFYEEGSFQNPTAARRELNKPDGMVEFAPGQKDRFFDLNNNLDLSQGQHNALVLAQARFDGIGPNAALTGDQNGSGRSLQIQQEAGATKLGPEFGGHDRFKKRTHQAVWHRIKQFWRAPQWVRVTDDQGAPEHIQLNAPDITEDEFGNRVINLDPEGRIAIKNDVAMLDVDILIEDAPDIINLQVEEREHLMRLREMGVGLPDKQLIESMNFHNKDKLVEAMEGGDDPQAQQLAAMQQQLAQVAQQLQMQNAELENQKLQVGNMLTAAQVQETRAKTEKLSSEADQLDLETDLSLQLMNR